jgi:hypothetical protein
MVPALTRRRNPDAGNYITKLPKAEHEDPARVPS